MAGDCYFETCIHYLPRQMSYGMVVKEFTDTVMGVAAYDPWMKDHPPKITMYQAGGAFEMDTEHMFVNAFREAFRIVKAYRCARWVPLQAVIPESGEILPGAYHPVRPR